MCAMSCSDMPGCLCLQMLSSSRIKSISYFRVILKPNLCKDFQELDGVFNPSCWLVSANPLPSLTFPFNINPSCAGSSSFYPVFSWRWRTVGQLPPIEMSLHMWNSLLITPWLLFSQRHNSGFISPAVNQIAMPLEPRWQTAWVRRVTGPLCLMDLNKMPCFRTEWRQTEPGSAMRKAHKTGNYQLSFTGLTFPHRCDAESL